MRPFPFAVIPPPGRYQRGIGKGTASAVPLETRKQTGFSLWGISAANYLLRPNRMQRMLLQNLIHFLRSSRLRIFHAAGDRKRVFTVLSKFARNNRRSIHEKVTMLHRLPLC